MPPIPDHYLYTVTYLDAGVEGFTTVKAVGASYFVEEGSLTVFKDQHHKAVLALRTESVLVVERGDAV
jgi:hypothetical protein